ncbi:hypothetical protein [Phycicoccus sp. Soil748]|uniref:hypothetical protein n=1 Tax=Intrasporangiaceae TaxID=85021 RepID=UPI0007029C49|nr:hypothetical protein [Phycicoccus sp. Soil748]KRE58791.1 hypothetical protein ASG70_16195 [Phycicoccus sp. Soil748]
MSHTTNIRRAASIAGATGLVALSMAGPASARPDPGSGSPGEQHCTTSCFEGGTVGGSSGVGTVLTVNDNGVQVLQIGAGLLAGVALAGAGMAVVSRRSHAHAAHPA